MDRTWGLVVLVAGAACVGQGAGRFGLFPSPEFDSRAVVSQGLSVTQEGDALVFSQGRQEAWPKAVLPMSPRLAGCSRLAVEAENSGMELLKIRFVPPGAVMPTARDALMALPHLELKPGEKGEIALPVKNILPLHQAVVKRLSEAGVVNADAGTAELTVFVYQTGQPRTFKITRIEAVGALDVLPEYGGWDADRFFPFIDRFGQFKHAEWTGKTRSDADLKTAQEQERRDLAAQPGPAEWNGYGGWAKGPKQAATGRFRVEKVEGKWGFVDPEGCLWWSHGVRGVTSEGAGVPLDGRVSIFEGLPGASAAQSPFVRTAGGVRAYDFRAANTSAKYGADWKRLHGEQAHARLRGWSVNTLGAGSAPEIQALRRTPYVERVLLSAPRVAGVGDSSLPLLDPYDPGFKKELDRQLAVCKAFAADPWCVGVGFASGIGAAKLSELGRLLLTAPAQQAAKQKLVASLKRRHGKIETLNAAWKASYADWEAVLASTNAPPAAASRDGSEFAEAFAEATFRGIAAAFKAAAPDTLNLGCLLREPEPALLRLAGWNADVVSLSREGLPLDEFEVSPYLERPVLLAEFRQGGEDDQGLLGVRPGAEAGRKAWRGAYAASLEAALKHPNVVGLHGLRYAAGGPGESGQPGGLVDVCDTPDAALAATAREAGARLYGARDGHRLRAAVTVDASKPLGPRREIERYINNSILMRSPPPELAKVIEKEYGRAKIVRCWVCLDDLWDIKTGAFNFNYPIKNRVKGAEADFEMPDIPFETYLAAFAGISDEVLLNVRRLERHVVEGRMAMAQWKEVCKAAVRRYKTICPNLRYIEALNEFHLSAFGDLNTKEYYAFYRTFYEIVNELNAELRPALPLLVGGPATTGRPPDSHLREFVALYAEDPAPDKRLDFLSYHYYGDQAWSEAASFEERMTALLDAHKIPSDIPMFWDEMGFTGSPWKVLPVARDLNRLQATCVTAFQYYSRKNRKLHVLPWVTFHSPSQTALTQFIYRPDGTLQMTPFGMTVKCWGMQKKNEVPTDSTGLRTDGSGLGAMGSVDENGAAVLLWNHQSLPCEVDLAVTGLPEAVRTGWRARRYLVDSRHSNCYADLSKAVALETAEESGGSSPGMTRQFVMEPYAVSLLLFEKP
jgi:hypothetical protein